MIELVIAERCVECNLCVKVCPTDVFDSVPGGPPVIARQQDCQTCFMCELYCDADALYVAPDCNRPTPVDEKALLASGLLGRYRRDSGWAEWSGDPRYTNEHWRMEHVFAVARAVGETTSKETVP